VVELAEKTITTPKVSRHIVAVSNNEYSIGVLEAAVRFPFGLTGEHFAPATRIPSRAWNQ
jgi:hypothetical protein